MSRSGANPAPNRLQQLLNHLQSTRSETPETRDLNAWFRNRWFRSVLPSQTQLGHLQWMMQKWQLKQDMFLLGPPTPWKRWLAFLFGSIVAGFEVDYLAISRDTTESELTMRRELDGNGSVVFVMQGLVQAALNGHLMILEGVERAERNVLALINGLLENREMRLENGKLLVSHRVYDQLIREGGQSPENLLRVHPQFLVICIGLPVPKYAGYPLDPPFRSRFQCRDIPTMGLSNGEIEQQLNRLLKIVELNLISETMSESVMEVIAKKITWLLLVINLMHELSRSPSSAQLTGRLPEFPTFLDPIAQLLAVSSDIPMACLMYILYPQLKLPVLPEDQRHLLLDLIQKTTGNPLQLSEPNFYKQSWIEEHVLSNPSRAFCPIPSHLESLKLMLALHDAKLDICIVGPKGCGKSTLIFEFARLNNYQESSILQMQLVADMTARDLLQRRSVTTSLDSQSNMKTEWKHSALVFAALNGWLAVLDGVDIISGNSFATLSRLFHDREVMLPDGHLLMEARLYDELKHILGYTDLEMKKRKKLLRIHPRFRIIAVGRVSKKLGGSQSRLQGDWMSPEFMNMLTFVPVSSLLSDEEFTVIKHHFGSVSLHAGVQSLLTLVRELRTSNNEMLATLGQSLNTRQLLRLVRRIANYPEESIIDGLKQNLLFSFLPWVVRDAFNSFLSQFQDTKSVKQHKTPLSIVKSDATLSIGDVSETIRPLSDAERLLVPNIIFYENPRQTEILYKMMKDFKLKEHILLIGNQGVGKNKIADYFLQLLNRPRQYIQLHRDSTIQSLTTIVSLVNGTVSQKDSPLILALKHGQVVIIDEADKAPAQVTAILKSLLENHDIILPDGRRITSSTNSDASENVLIRHPEFRMIVLANRPGFPFLGNDFYRELGDFFAVHAVENPDQESELELVRPYGKRLPESMIKKLSDIFVELRKLYDAGHLQYPYSTRELVNVIRHMSMYPEDGIMESFKNVFDFDMYNSEVRRLLATTLRQMDIYIDDDLNAQTFELAQIQSLPKPRIWTPWKITRPDRTGISINSRPLSLPGSWNFTGRTSKRSSDKRDLRTSHYSEKLFAFRFPVPSALKSCSMFPDGSLLGHCENPLTLFLASPGISEIIEYDISASIGNANGGFQVCSLIERNHRCAAMFHTESNRLFVYNFDRNIISAYSLDVLEYPGARQFVSDYSSSGILIFTNGTHKVLLLDFSNKSVQMLVLPDPVNRIFVATNDLWLLESAQTRRRFFVKIQWPEFNVKNVLIADELGEQIEILHAKLPFLCRGPSNAEYGGLLRETDLSSISLFKRSSPLVTNKSSYFMTTRNELLVVAHSLHAPGMVMLECVDMHRSLYFSRTWNFEQPFNNLYLLEVSDGTALVCCDNGRGMAFEFNHEQIRQRFENWSAPQHLKAHGQSLTGSMSNLGASDMDAGDNDMERVGGRSRKPLTRAREQIEVNMQDHELRKTSKIVDVKLQTEAQSILRQLRAKHIADLNMSDLDAKMLEKRRDKMQLIIKSLRNILESAEAKSKERVWLHNQTNGELDDRKLIDGLVGEKNIFKRRGESIPVLGMPLPKRKFIHFSFDLSASMVRYNPHDGRLERSLEAALLIMESFKNFQHKYSYQITGHSGDAAEVSFVNDQTLPQNDHDVFMILEKMHAHALHCITGDKTVHALTNAVDSMNEITDADERIVILLSDANIEQYGIDPQTLVDLIGKHKQVETFIIFIGSIENQAENLRKLLPAGHGFLCHHVDDLPVIMRNILQTSVL